ncbi:MAG: hypothetical protein QY302_18710 [Anaerolineales bacterium]|nr:MAG: hypothetical protein QY302_18710 [Anaerolineales bacterium]
MKIALSLSIILVLLAGCGPSQEAVATQTSLVLTSTAAVWTKTATPTPTSTATPTHTPTPSVTPTPTSTPFAGLRLDKLIMYRPNMTDDVTFFQATYIGDIEVSSTNGDNPINLTSNQTGNKVLGGWSPDGDWIVYGLWQGDTPDDIPTIIAKDGTSYSTIELWKMNSDGNNKSRIPIEISGNDFRFANRQENWDDNNLLIPCPTGEDQTELCIVNVADATVLKTGNFGEEPSYAPDRTQYAWQISQSGVGIIEALLSNSSLGNLFVIRQGESYPVKLPNPDPQKFIREYHWLPDSNNIIVLFGNKNLGEIYSIQADGTKDPVLILSIKAQLDYAWFSSALSPDGNHLLITAYPPRSGNERQDCVVNLVEKTYICINLGWQNFVWTPDGQLVGQKHGVAFIFDLTTAKPAQANQLNWLFSHLRVLLQP